MFPEFILLAAQRINQPAIGDGSEKSRWLGTSLALPSLSQARVIPLLKIVRLACLEGESG